MLSPYCGGNLGDTTILEALITTVRSQWPSAEIRAVTLDPEETLKRHGVDGITLSALYSEFYPVREPERSVQDSPKAAPASPAAPVSSGGSTRGTIVRALKHLGPVFRLLKGTRDALVAAAAEARHLARSWRFAREVRLLIVAGGGQIDSQWGGPLGHPYSLMKWSLLARLAGARVAYLSVGVCELGGIMSRMMFRTALRAAHYRSYRDPGSRALLANWAFTRADAICPDLAFGLLDSFATEDRGVPGRTVAVSPIAWSDPGAWPSADAEANRLYRARMTELFEKLTDRGFTAALFATARPDFRTANELRAALLARRPELESRLLPCVFLDSPSGARALFETAQVTVASRLHGLLLAAMAGQPVIALSYDRKVDELMREIEQMERRADIATFDAERICAWVEDAVRRRTELRGRIGDLLAGANRTVSMQLRQIAAEVG